MSAAGPYFVRVQPPPGTTRSRVAGDTLTLPASAPATAASRAPTTPPVPPMPHRDELPTDGAPLDLKKAGERWLRWLHQELARRGDTPRARLLSLWDVLEEWFATEGFAASLVARAALALRSDPDDPVGSTVAEHRRAVRRLLEELADAAGAADPAGLAAQLHVLLEGAVASAMIERRPDVARTARRLAAIALARGAA
jgi:hypothetical protein